MVDDKTTSMRRELDGALAASDRAFAQALCHFREQAEMSRKQIVVDQQRWTLYCCLGLIVWAVVMFAVILWQLPSPLRL